MPFTSCKRCGYSTTADFVVDPSGRSKSVGQGTCPNCGARLDLLPNGVKSLVGSTGGAIGVGLLGLFVLYFVVKVLIPPLSGGMQAPDPGTRVPRTAPSAVSPRESRPEDQVPLNAFELKEDRTPPSGVPDNTATRLPNLHKAIAEAAKKAAAESSPAESPDRRE